MNAENAPNERQSRELPGVAGVELHVREIVARGLHAPGSRDHLRRQIDTDRTPESRRQWKQVHARTAAEVQKHLARMRADEPPDEPQAPLEQALSGAVALAIAGRDGVEERADPVIAINRASAQPPFHLARGAPSA